MAVWQRGISLGLIVVGGFALIVGMGIIIYHGTPFPQVSPVHPLWESWQYPTF